MSNKQIGTAHRSDISADILTATVTSIYPLLITVDSSLTLDESHLIIPHHLKGGEIMFTDNGAERTVVLADQLSQGVHVLILRAGGGQKYAILGIID